MAKPHIVCFLGVGGVGKTTVLDSLRDNRQDVPFSFNVCPSPTRQAYAKMGLTTEAAGLALGSDKEEELQTVVYQTYKDVVKTFVEKNQHVDALVFDRSAYDYVGYQLTRFPHWSSAKVYAIQEDLKQFYIQTFEGHEVSHVYFPFPAPWLDEETVEDFRHRPHAKNYVWDSVIKRLFRDWRPGVESYLSLSTNLSSSSRADLLVSYLTHNFGVGKK